MAENSYASVQKLKIRRWWKSLPDRFIRAFFPGNTAVTERESRRDGVIIIALFS